MILVLVLGFTVVYGCDCNYKSFEENYKNADIVFLAKVIDIADDQDIRFKNTLHYHIDSLYTDKGGYSPKFRILKIYKGDFNQPTVDGEYQYKNKSSLCDVFFQRNRSYLVFGYFDENGKLSTNIYTSTRIANDVILKRVRSLEE